MFLSKHINGNWYLFYNDNTGKRRKISTNSKLKSEALKFLTKFEKKIKERNEHKTIPIDLKSFRNEYLKQSKTIHRPKTTKYLITVFNSLIDFIGNVQLSSITVKQIKDFLQMKYSVSPYTAQKYLAHIRKAFNEAIVDDYLDFNPCLRISNFRIPERQPSFFSENEFKKLLGVIENEDIKDLIQFAVNTALRRSEITDLRWNQINFKDRLLILDNNSNITKSQKIGTVPLNLTVLQILNRREFEKKSDFVFTYQNNPIKPDFITKKFKKLIIKAGLNPKYKFHSLRHTAASWIVQRGGSILAVCKLLRHSELKITEIYAHLRPEDLINSVELLEG